MFLMIFSSCDFFTEKKNPDSKNPEKCMVQYDAKSSRIVGIMCLALWGGMIFIVTRKSSSNEESSH